MSVRIRLMVVISYTRTDTALESNQLYTTAAQLRKTDNENWMRILLIPLLFNYIIVLKKIRAREKQCP